MSEAREALDQLAGALSAISVVVAEICKALPSEAQVAVREQIKRLQENASGAEGSFAVSVRETCERLLQEM